MHTTKKNVSFERHMIMNDMISLRYISENNDVLDGTSTEMLIN